jgi:hypothetical protein
VQQKEKEKKQTLFGIEINLKPLHLVKGVLIFKAQALLVEAESTRDCPTTQQSRSQRSWVIERTVRGWLDAKNVGPSASLDRERVRHYWC